jgi:3-oxochol-4-en-24-oyl-CoA dehydrogenase
MTLGVTTQNGTTTRDECSEMNLDLTVEQEALRETIGRFLDKHSSPDRVRAALPSGFDDGLWRGLAGLGAIALRVPEAAGGLGLGTFEASLLMEEAGRTLVSGPLAEATAAATVLASFAPEDGSVLGDVLEGERVVVLASNDILTHPVQWVAGGAVAHSVIARAGDDVVLVDLAGHTVRTEPNLASTPLAEISLTDLPRMTLGSGAAAIRVFAAAVEEWKLLMASALSGLAREAIRLASVYARERTQFGQLIGAYQAISHPLADLITEVEGGRLFVWKAIYDTAVNSPEAGANISLCLWWNADVAGRAVSQALQTFGGYGLTTEYDIHLYNLRAKAWPLVFGDPERLREEAGRRRYAGEITSLPEVGRLAIDLDLGDDARRFADELDGFFRTTLTPEMKAKSSPTWDGHDPGVHRNLAKAGLLFPAWPAEWGGHDASPYVVAAGLSVWEDHGWSTHAAAVTQMVGAMIRRFGGSKLKAEVLGPIARGEVICSLGYSEPHSGSDVFAAKTRATPDGDGWRIDGQKMFTSGADIADYVLMLTRTNIEVAKHQGLTMFVVPLRSEGVVIQPVRTFQDEPTNITYYEGVHVPDTYRLGPIDGATKVLAAALELEQGGTSSRIQARMLAAAEELCRTKDDGGRTRIDEPAVQARLARTHANAEVCAMLYYRSLWAKVAEKDHVAFGPMSKMFSSERYLSDARDLLDLTAPMSLSQRNGPAEFLNLCYRQAHGPRIYAGTSQILRSVIAERFLGLPRSRAV